MPRKPSTPKPNLTIVGGQPRREERVIPGSENTEIPVGFEMLLYRAAQDPELKLLLLSDRDAAIASAGIRLRPAERATLDAVSDEALGRMIDRIEPSNPQRRKFMGNVAAAVTSLAAGTVAFAGLGGCDEDTSGTTPGGSATGPTTTTYTTPTGGVGGAGVTPAGSGGSTTTTNPGGFGGAGIGPGGWGGGGGEPGGGGAGGSAGSGG